MTRAYRGSCLCGAVSFEAEQFDEQVAHCHCSMCRKFHGAEFATIAGVRRAAFRWLGGQDFLAGYRAAIKVIINTASGPLRAESQESLGYMRPLIPNWLSNSEAPEKSIPWN